MQGFGEVILAAGLILTYAATVAAVLTSEATARRPDSFGDRLGFFAIQAQLVAFALCFVGGVCVLTFGSMYPWPY